MNDSKTKPETVDGSGSSDCSIAKIIEELNTRYDDACAKENFGPPEKQAYQAGRQRELLYCLELLGQ